MEEREEVLHILHNKSLSYIDRIIQIDKMVSGEDWDAQKLADSLDVPIAIVEADPEYVTNVQELPKARTPVKIYIEAFSDCYQKIKGQKFVFTKMDIGQLINIKKVCDLETFDKILNCITTSDQHKASVKLDFEMANMIRTLTPVKIYKNLNYLLEKSSTYKMKPGWGYSFIKKKDGR